MTDKYLTYSLTGEQKAISIDLAGAPVAIIFKEDSGWLEILPALIEITKEFKLELYEPPTDIS